VVGSVKERGLVRLQRGDVWTALTVNVKGVVQNPDSLTGTATMGPLGNATFSAKRQRR
jgi:hypothetical protein